MNPDPTAPRTARCHVCERHVGPLDDGGRLDLHFDHREPVEGRADPVLMGLVGIRICPGSGQTPQSVEKECGQDPFCVHGHLTTTQCQKCEQELCIHATFYVLAFNRATREWFKYTETKAPITSKDWSEEARFRCQSCRAVFRLEGGRLVEEKDFQDSGGNIMTPREGKPHSADGPIPLTPPSFQKNQQPEGGDAKCGALIPQRPSADPVPSSVGTTTWTYSQSKALLRINGNPFAIVSPDLTNGLSDKDASVLLSALNHQTLSSDLRALLSRHSPLSPEDRASINDFYLSQCEGVTDSEILDKLEEFISVTSKCNRLIFDFDGRHDLRSAVIAAITAEGKEKTALTAERDTAIAQLAEAKETLEVKQSVIEMYKWHQDEDTINMGKLAIDLAEARRQLAEAKEENTVVRESCDILDQIGIALERRGFVHCCNAESIGNLADENKALNETLLQCHQQLSRLRSSIAADFVKREDVDELAHAAKAFISARYDFEAVRSEYSINPTEELGHATSEASCRWSDAEERLERAISALAPKPTAD